MTHEVKVRQAGGSVAVTIPKEIAERFSLRPGDTVVLSEMGNGVMLRPHTAEFDRMWKLYEEGAKKYANALRELAK